MLIAFASHSGSNSHKRQDRLSQRDPLLHRRMGSKAEGDLYDLIGSFGLWQKTVFTVLFYTNTVGIWQNFAMTFLAPNIDFRCIEPHVDPYNVTAWPGQCTVELTNGSTLPCTKWEYDTTNYPDTLVNQFDLVCDRAWLISFSKSVYMIGFMVSVFIFGQVSDRFGRLPTMIISYSITCISMIMSLFSTSVVAFLVFRFLQAFGRTGLTTTGYVLLMEMVGPEHRTFVGIVIQLGWCCGFFFLAFIGYFFRHWFWFQVAIAIPIFPIALAFIFIPESPRWLLMRKSVDRLKKLVVTAAKRNGKEVKGDIDDIVNKLIKVNENENRGTIVDLFRTPRMRCRTFNMMYLWLVNAFVYYALSFNTNDMSGDPYLNFLIAGALEFPSYGALYFSIRRFGRRPTLVTLMLLGGAVCLALVAVPTSLPWVSTVLSQSGKFCVTASFGLLYLYTGELFPTVVRNAGLGSCSTVARIGSIVAPFSREMGQASHPAVPNVLYCVLAVTSGLFALKLPETMGRQLPDTLEEGESFEIEG